MRRTVRFNRFALAFLAIGVTATSASADWHTFWHNMHVGYHRNNAWPDPFNEVDAAQVAAPFEVMKHNGWRIHNTIGHELFRESDGALLASGNRRVHWIASQSPQTRRSIYVVRGGSPEETQARVASVQQTLTGLNLHGPVPPVMVTDVEPGTSSGAWANKVSREWLEHLPLPQLPRESAAGNTSVATPGS
ncbi:hypothetical protein K227x_00500 [Rubripirellula lacrimiformis]|uniref:Uncharacterized protein n=1 Tax=Rubripirellula lacrimiformis TaxID=1930273 RepID=A0A517N3H6_9BACT|nr:hypothetical protein [Rubripirellula lacrimiformis]QDT01683.1 hypothetical protein K227x_00500 [Rubripirellula lacrimiformis]